jgi:peptidoglycan/LPS O-acetylase OafA/YrhL
MVIFSHTYFWVGSSQVELLASYTKDMTFGALGVSIFFVISGYLIAKSWDKTKSMVKFFWNRVLRIIPGLVVVAFFAILIIGPLTTSLSLIDYFKNIHTWEYLRVITMYFWIDTLPGVTLGGNVANINGVLWTIPIEFTMYALVAILGFTGILYRRYILPALTAITVIFYSYLLTFPVNPLISSVRLPFITPGGQTNVGLMIDFFGLMTLFMLGTIFYIYRDLIKFNGKTALVCVYFILLFDVLYIIGVPYFYQLSILSWHILLPYVILFIAFLPIKSLNSFGKMGDFSYGLYIYAWPIQLLVTKYFGGRVDILSGFAAYFLIALFFAYLSWNLIEKRALKLKETDSSKFFMTLKERTFLRSKRTG